MADSKQENLFKDLPPPAEKPLLFKKQHRPLWTQNKAKLIERYLFYFVMITKHGTYIDGFAAPQDRKNPESWACKLVLESKPQYLREFWLCDIDEKGYADLDKLARSIRRPKSHKVNTIQGDFNLKVHDVLANCKIGEKQLRFVY